MSLPNECILEIFSKIKDDKNSLFSCLLVNRQWCRNAVPILWSDPLCFPIKPSLIETYLSTLNIEEKKKLATYKIDIPDVAPLFSYGSYIMFFETTHLRSGINSWLRLHWMGYDKKLSFITANEENIKEDITNALIKMFLQSSNGFKKLILNRHDLNLIPHPTILLDYSHGLSQLTSLEYSEDNVNNENFELAVDLLTILSKICTTIQQINFSLCDNKITNSCANIIRSQGNLKCLSFSGIRNDVEINVMLLALNQSHFLSLRYITLNRCNFLAANIGLISYCKNLIKLKIDSCKRMTLDHCTSLSKRPLRLKDLRLFNFRFHSEVASSLITMWGSTLKTLHIDRIDTQELSTTLVNYCSNLDELSVKLFKRDIYYISLFLRQSSLKHLRIYIINWPDMNLMFLNKLCQILPASLTYLELFNNIPAKNFTFLLKNCFHLVNLENFIIHIRSPIEFENFKEHFKYLKMFVEFHKMLKNVVINADQWYYSYNLQIIDEVVEDIKMLGVKCKYSFKK
ncbi:hypothetical protein C2G38_2248326 [Gigaspora rosea]|uniref:F-box domain-containing protein n=1 Tax=Gigaspora rosea TaxID=44941 RepID=A0A397UZV9_9GLOM|nr:hypothetical protein C2G38_2248326 [Gigaspora rosea]